MKKALVTLLVALIGLLAISQNTTRGYMRITEMQAMEYDGKEYKITQPWVKYDAKVFFTDKIMFLGGKDDKVGDLTTWLVMHLKVCEVSVDDKCKRETCAWTVGDTKVEVLTDLKRYHNGVTCLDQVVGRVIFRYRIE